MATEEEEQTMGKGFAGLSSLVSNVDSIPPSSAKNENAGPPPDVARKTDRRTEQSAQPKQQPVQEKYQTTSQPSSGSSIGKWALGIAAVIWVLGLIGEWSQKPSSSQSSYSPPAHTQALQSKGSSQFDPATAKPDETQVPSRPAETMPPVEQGLLLSTPQIRYCLAEGIRLDGARATVDNYNDSHVDRFNAMVADYNNRCGQYRYRSGVLETARSEVEAYRPTLQSEGRARFSKFGSSSMSASVPSSSGSSAFSTRSPPAPTSAPKYPAITDGERVLTLMEQQSGVWTATRYRKAYAAFKAAEHADPSRQQFWASKADYALERAEKLDEVTSSARDDSKASSSVSPSSAITPKSPTIQSTSPSHSFSSESPELSDAEKASLESACSTDKYVNGPASYRACLDRQMAALATGVKRPNLSALSSTELQSIESACSTDKYVNGPAAYNKCLASQLAAMTGQQNRRPDLSRLSSSELQSIESACSTDKYVNGPAAYNRCLTTQIAALNQQGSRPDLSRLSPADRSSIESACSTDKYVNGPAAYNGCVSRQLERFRD